MSKTVLFVGIIFVGCIVALGFLGVYGMHEYIRTRPAQQHKDVKPAALTAKPQVVQQSSPVAVDHAAMHHRAGEQLNVDDLKACIRGLEVITQPEDNADKDKPKLPAPEVFAPNGNGWRMMSDLQMLPVTGMFHGHVELHEWKIKK